MRLALGVTVTRMPAGRRFRLSEGSGCLDTSEPEEGIPRLLIEGREPSSRAAQVLGFGWSCLGYRVRLEQIRG